MCYFGGVERIGVRELRQHASRYLDLVKAGETVEVTERGELIALLVPAQRADTPRDRLRPPRKLTPASVPTGRLQSPRPVPTAVGEPTNAELLDAERDDER